MPALKRRIKSVQSMEILNMLITQKRYRITDEEFLDVIRCMFPKINLPSRRSRRFHKNRTARVLTTSSAERLITCLRSENFASMVGKVLPSNLDLTCYIDTMSDLQWYVLDSPNSDSQRQHYQRVQVLLSSRQLWPLLSNNSQIWVVLTNQYLESLRCHRAGTGENFNNGYYTYTHKRHHWTFLWTRSASAWYYEYQVMNTLLLATLAL